MAAMAAVLTGCQVFEPLHYVYLPADRETGEAQSSYTEGSDVEGKEEAPAVLSDGEGRSLRFRVQSEQEMEMDGHVAPMYQLHATIVDIGLVRNLYRKSRSDDNRGRLPDLFFLEMRFRNNSGQVVSINPYESRILCGKTILNPLEPDAYLAGYAGFANSWLSYGWHMTPRFSQFFFRPAEASLHHRSTYHLSQKDRKAILSMELHFLQDLRKPISVPNDSTIMLLLPFPRLPSGKEECTLSLPFPGNPSAARFRFRYLRLDESQYQKLKDGNGLWESQGRVYALERREFLQQLALDEKRAQQNHERRREEFCSQLGEEEKEGFDFCSTSIFSFFDSGFD